MPSVTTRSSRYSSVESERYRRRHNVVAWGSPAQPTGIIDFSNAYFESTLADLGFALWRSGRPSQRATAFSPTRIAAYLAGYGSRRPLVTEDVERVLVYLHARGLQILEKQARLAPTIDAPLLARLAWLHDHRTDLHDAVTRRLQRRAK
jgi:Ser/Thr protein kinase RdoA (MazF antagonist)